jgi:cell division septation protein DedD
MKFYLYLLIVAIIFTASCAGTNKSLRNSRNKDKENTVKGTSIKKTLMPAGPIKEVEEKLVSNDEKEDPSPQKYFVIIGSFKDPENAKEHLTIVKKDGFKPVILKNDAGLYRVSVMATDDITDARNEVRRIWAKFPKYSDTWMLIRIEK